MDTFKQQCIELRKQDYTLPEIMKITGRPKTSILFHIRNIPLSVKKQQQIREASQARLSKAGRGRKGKSARPFTTISQWNQQAVYLVSHLLFDGEITQNACMYHNRNKVLVTNVEIAMRAFYNFEPKRYHDPTTGVLRIGYYNVALASHLKKKSQRLLSEIFTVSKQFKREFLRAFFDDEGCMDFRLAQNTRRVRGYQKNTDILNVVQKLLDDFSISSVIQLPNEVVIRGKKNLERFEKEINFSPGVRINGKCSNSVWKRNIEKRELLRRAIESFQS